MSVAQAQVTPTESTPSDKKGTVLIVDDDVSMKMLLESYVEDIGYDFVTACDGKEAVDYLKHHYQSVDIVLIDREMPVMDGLQAVLKMKEDAYLADIPVIMQTSSTKPEQIQEGIDAGVFYYLTKPVDINVLESVLTAAEREVEKRAGLTNELEKHQECFQLIEACKFYYRSVAEAESLAGFIANCFPEPKKIVTGLAEILVNSVEHGNLRIGYDMKGQLLQEGMWREEAQRRLGLPEYRDLWVEVVFKKGHKGYFIKVVDSGDGFDWKKYMTVDPSRSSDTHGRGIALANAVSFDSITYNEKGNEVTLFVSAEPDIDW